MIQLENMAYSEIVWKIYHMKRYYGFVRGH